MIIKAIRSDKVYLKMMTSPIEKRNDIYRYELMKPFEKKWGYYHVSLKAPKENGYDVIMASTMLGHLAPAKIDATQEKNIKLLSSDLLWTECQKSIEKSVDCFTDNGIDLPVKEYLYSILLADPQNPYIILCDGYSGEGGIPGYINAWLVPSEKTMKRLPACLAHEMNHNVRFQFIEWKNDITLGEMIVSEGLAENFVTHIYGEDMIGPWVSKTEIHTLNKYIKPIIREGLDVQGMDNLNAYLYGDEMAVLQGFTPMGLPYCAGYACGYHLIKHYLKKTRKSMVEATILPATEILNAVKDFWEEH